MDPYEELGVVPSASLAEIEARYRLLLREHHPDLHHHEGQEATEAAELATQRLNDAIAAIRVRWSEDRTPTERPTYRSSPRPPQSSPPSESADDDRIGDDDWWWSRSDVGRPRGTPTGGPWPGENPFWRPPDAPPTHDPETGERIRAEQYDWIGEPIEHRPDDPVPCPFCGRPYDRLDDYEYHLESIHHFRRTVAKPPRHRGAITRALGRLRYLPAWLLALLAFAIWIVLGFWAFVAMMTFLALVLYTQTSPHFRE
jgi:hypothetical protein